MTTSRDKVNDNRGQGKKKRRVHIQEPADHQQRHSHKNGGVNKIPFKQMQIGQCVGRGTFGVVYRGNWDDHAVAIKHVGTREWDRTKGSNDKTVPKEVVLLSKVKHRNIIDFYGYSEKSNHIYLVMEYADCGSLYDVIHRDNPQYGPVLYSPVHVMNWALQIAEAIEYLHNIRPRPIIHRDLKPSNILLTSECERVKICDFGEARFVHSEMTNQCGTPLWMAPEVINGRKYSEKCDVYSFGIILWEMLARKKPYHDLEVEERGIFLAVYKGLRPMQVKDTPDAFTSLIESCWKQTAEERPSFTELVVFLDLAFKYLHEGDEGIFSVIGKKAQHPWYTWSNNVIVQRNDDVISTRRIDTIEEENCTEDETMKKRGNIFLNFVNKFRKGWWVSPAIFLTASIIVYLFCHRRK